MVSKQKLKEILKQAIHEFYINDKILVENRGMEQACVFRIGLYLNNIIKEDPELSQLDLDCEYNKCNRGPKELDGVKVRPDLILHKRNLNSATTDPYNTLVVEFKGWWNNNTNDIEKLKKFTSYDYCYSYPLAIWIKLGKTHNEVTYKYFKNGHEIAENEL